MRPKVGLLIGLLILGVHAPVLDASSSEDSTRMEALRSLGLESIPGRMPAFYSPGSRARAQYLQTLLGGEIDYWAAQMQVTLRPITLAVLTSAQWPTVAGNEPYGMPSVDGVQRPVFVMPTSWVAVTWMVIPKREDVPPAMLRKALVHGRQWDRVKFEGCDGIGTHEIGHSVIHQLGIDPKTHWFSEFLASYVGYAYLKAVDPEQAYSNVIFWTVGLKNSPHVFTELADFESRYDELQEKYPGNYAWYQLALDQRVMEIYAEKGVGYIREVRKQFPVGGAALDSAQLLSKLEAMDAGWQAWAARQK